MYLFQLSVVLRRNSLRVMEELHYRLCALVPKLELLDEGIIAYIIMTEQHNKT